VWGPDASAPPVRWARWGGASPAPRAAPSEAPGQDQDKQDQKNQQQQQQPQQQQPKPDQTNQQQQKNQMPKQQAERILDALRNNEKEIQKQLRKRAAAKIIIEKDW